MADETLAARVRAKYPGVYDDLSDAALEAKVRAKYPGVYDDVPSTVVEPARTPNRPQGPATIGEIIAARNVRQSSNIADTAKGAYAGLKSTVYHGGDLIRRWFGMDRVIETPEVQAAITPPDSTAGRLGFMAEQGAEYAAPLGAASKLTKGMGLLKRTAAQAAAGAGVAGLQSAGDGVEMGVASGLSAAFPMASAAVKPVIGLVKRAAAGAQEGGLGGAIASAVRSVAPGKPRELLMQGLKPRSVKTQFPASLDLAIPEIKAAEAAIGRPVADIESLLAATKAAKAKIQGDLNVLRGVQRNAGATVDLSPVADAMVTSIPKKVMLETPDAALRMKAAADVYRKPFTLDEAETLLRETNAELESFYAMHPQARRASLLANPAVAALDAQGKALRDVIYQQLDSPGQGAAARALNRRYGALMEIEGEAVRRSNVAARQQPESLSEQIGAVRAAGEMARGLWRLTHGDLAGAADIAAARAGRSAATAIKQAQTTDALIKRAFESYTPREVR